MLRGGLRPSAIIASITASRLADCGADDHSVSQCRTSSALTNLGLSLKSATVHLSSSTNSPPVIAAASCLILRALPISVAALEKVSALLLGRRLYSAANRSKSASSRVLPFIAYSQSVQRYLWG